MKSDLKRESVNVTVTLPEEIAQRVTPQAKQEIASIVATAKQGVLRALSRAEQPEGYERIEIVQQRGPTIEFFGRLLCSDEFESGGREAYTIGIELYQSRGGAYVAVSSARPTDREGWESVRATVVSPSENEDARRFEVLSAFDWNQCARRMVIRKLKWSLRQDIE